jgi:creatinine amidohydrolase/Fe(II)-dependent formamide hydrolase-like protein
MKRVPILIATALVAVSSPPLQAQQGRPSAAERERRFQEEMAEPRPIDALNSVWIEELTWMEVRDDLAKGMTTAIIPTGGVEPNGPYLATGKHNYVLQGTCEAIARELGNALCAPIVKLVPEGGIEEPTGHMRYPGTISLHEETFEAVLRDVAMSLESHGFENIVFIGDSGGNQQGMAAAADDLNEMWVGTGSRAHFIPEYYTYADVLAYMENDLGVVQTEDDGLHDDFAITSLMMVTDPTTVRFDQRVKAGRTTINGVSITPKDKALDTGLKLLRFRVDTTARAIRASIAEGR